MVTFEGFPGNPTSILRHGQRSATLISTYRETPCASRLCCWTGLNGLGFIYFQGTTSTNQDLSVVPLAKKEEKQNLCFGLCVHIGAFLNQHVVKRMLQGDCIFKVCVEGL